MCAVTGRVFEPVGLMKRDLDVHAQLGVELIAGPTLGVRVCFVFACRCCNLHRLRFPLRFALPTHTVDPPRPTTTSPSSTTHSNAPPFALADSPPPLPSTALSNLPKQALHPPHNSLIQPPAVATSSILHTANSPPSPALCARHRPPPGEILELQAHPGEPKFAYECAVSPLSGWFWLILTEARAVRLGR